MRFTSARQWRSSLRCPLLSRPLRAVSCLCAERERLTNQLVAIRRAEQLVANALQRSSPLRLIGIAVVTGALLLSHYWALWLISATTIVLAWRAWRKDGAERTATVKVLAAVARS